MVGYYEIANTPYRTDPRTRGKANPGLVSLVHNTYAEWPAHAGVRPSGKADGRLSKRMNRWY